LSGAGDGNDCGPSWPLPSLPLGSLKRSQSAVLPIGRTRWVLIPSTRDKKGPIKGPSFCLERVMGIEPTLCAWEAQVLPLNYTRALSEIFSPASLPARSRFSYRLPGLPDRACPACGALLPTGYAGCRSPIELHPRCQKSFPWHPCLRARDSLTACPAFLTERSQLVELRSPPATPDAIHPLNYTRALSEIFSLASLPALPVG
jgi:hypothetical protein